MGSSASTKTAPPGSPMAVASWASAACSSFCACTWSNLAPDRFTLAKLTSSVDLNLLSARAVTWSTTVWRAFTVSSDDLQDGSGAKDGEIGVAGSQKNVGAVAS